MYQVLYKVYMHGTCRQLNFGVVLVSGENRPLNLQASRSECPSAVFKIKSLVGKEKRSKK